MRSVALALCLASAAAFTAVPRMPRALVAKSTALSAQQPHGGVLVDLFKGVDVKAEVRKPLRFKKDATPSSPPPPHNKGYFLRRT